MTANAPKDLADIVERLRSVDEDAMYAAPATTEALLLEAATEIERLRSTPEALSVEAVAKLLRMFGEFGTSAERERVVSEEAAEAVLALLSSTRREPSELVQELHKLPAVVSHPENTTGVVSHNPDFVEGFAAGIETAAACADQWGKSQELRLRCREMKAQELRTAVAVAKGIASAIRAHTPASHLSATTEETALKARITDLEDALRPFAKTGQLFEPPPFSDHETYDACIFSPAAGREYNLAASHLRRAARALPPKDTSNGG